MCICVLVEYMYFTLKINVTGDTTRATVVGLNPFSNYNCTLHAVTVSSGPMTDPIIVRTAEKGTCSAFVEYVGNTCMNILHGCMTVCYH